MTTLHEVELGVLGPLQVRQYGLPVAIPGAKPRAILTLLGLHGGAVVPAGTLVELLWGDDPPRTAAKALQTHISALRRALGDGFVVTEGTGWSLRTTAIDASRYQVAARLGRDAFAGGDAGQAVARFDEALQLWRGVPELPDGPRGESERTRWVEGHAALVEDRADALLATGRAAEIIGELEAAIADAPLRERRWGQLMLALYRAGRQGEALGAYQRVRTLLADELGVDPGPDLRRLEAAIVAQDSALELPDAQQLSSVTRAVTFLLTDIEGSTAAWEADADAMALALARHDELVEQVVTSRGGRLIKTRGEGDATFSVFDRPSAAAAAAIELQEAIRHEPWALQQPMRVRVALHTGEVELRDGDYFGRAVNRAARLRSLAAGGQILCSGATAELVIDSLSDDIVLADLGTRQLKNLARPEHVFELRLETDDDSPAPTPDAPIERPDMPAVLAGSGPFVGRSGELQRLFAAWQTTLDGGTRAVLIAGEPGVGKTRLAGEWSRQAYEEGTIVLYGRCDEDLGAPYQPFAEALRSLAPCLGVDRLRGLRGVEALLPLVPGLADVLPDLAAPLRADPDTERYALFDAVVALLGIASRNAPVVVILDDLHWAAKPTLLLLRHLLRFGDQARVQIVGTYRSTDLDRSHPLAAMLADLHRDGSADRLALGGLTANDVTAYVAEAGYDDEELARALAAVTGGNPFFLIEALRHVAESGGRWNPSTLPQGVREAVSRRLSRLSIETNKALAAAAVVGSRFSIELVERVAGTDLVDAFDEACAAGIVVEEPEGRYRFNHALVRQSLLAELASVRRMRLHQRIAATLETEPGADDELLAELAYHYFECAWAGNAAKAVDYCRRAADQAMARLAYEGAADYYDKALHALDELDDELADRDDLEAELLVARCEALLAAGDVASATSAVAQLRAAAGDSARLAAWGTCFGGELSMLTEPERLDDIAAEVAAAAEELAGLGDAAGEAKAHTVRAMCLGRLGRIADCETALDQALTAARKAHEHRRVNAVLATAPLAALWGPNPVPRAGGRCLDVVRLLRITTGSPVVEATSTRCQGVLDAFRGRPSAGRQLIESARRSLTELGMRHALLEVDQFAGILELVADDPAAAEPYLRRAYNGFRRMGLDADTAETAALLARACVALDRDTEADELCAESERLAGHALKPAIAWRTVRAKLLARSGAHDQARRVAEEAVAIAARTDALVDHGDACLALATVLSDAGDDTGARSAAERALALYELKAAATLAERAREIMGQRGVGPGSAATEAPPTRLSNACARTGARVADAVNRKDWTAVEQLYAPNLAIESRRSIVGFVLTDLAPGEWVNRAKQVYESGDVRLTQDVIAVRGQRLALIRLLVSTADATPGAPYDEFLQVYRVDDDGRIDMQVWFDIEDLDAATAELDAAHARVENTHRRAALENAASRADARFNEFCAHRRWEELRSVTADDIRVEDRRSGLRSAHDGRASLLVEVQTIGELGTKHVSSEVVAVRGKFLALVRVLFLGSDTRPDAFRTEMLRIVEIAPDERIVAITVFDPADIDAAIAELDARYLAGEAAPHARVWQRAVDALGEANRHEAGPVLSALTYVDHQRVSFGSGDFGRAVEELWTLVPNARYRITAVHALDARGTVAGLVIEGADAHGNELQWPRIVSLVLDEPRMDVYDDDDLDAALTHFEEVRPRRWLENAASRLSERFLAYLTARDWDALTDLFIEGFCYDDRRRAVNSGVRRGRGHAMEDIQAAFDLGLWADLMAVVVATRGTRLALSRLRALGRDPEAIQLDVLVLVETDTDERFARVVVFDVDDIDAAFTELEACYVAGEAETHAHTWSLATQAYAAFNRRELTATTPDWANIDHRRGAAFAPGDMFAYLEAAWKDSPDTKIYIAAVHRLNDLGAVVTHRAQGISQDGFDAEWRDVHLLTVEGEKVNRSELFDETDVDVAVARLEELSRPASRLENAASRADERFWRYFAARDWDATGEMVADEVRTEDRRRVVNAGLRHGRDALIAECSALAEVGAENAGSDVIATRGDRLALIRVRLSVRDQSPETFFMTVLVVVETDNDGTVTARILFDVDDIDAAFEEVNARYLAGEAADYAHTWSAVATAYNALKRHELPPTVPGWEGIDRRMPATIARGDMTTYLRASWNATPNAKIYIRAVHRLTATGAVVTHAAYGTSQQGFEAEWQDVAVVTFDGELLERCELFDEAGLDSALARADELTLSQSSLRNAASEANDEFDACFAARDWNGISQILSENTSTDDRRRVVNAGMRRGREAEIDSMRAVAELGVTSARSTVIAVRGRRLALSRTEFSGDDRRPGAFGTEILDIVEIDETGRIAARIAFDADEMDAAIAELETRFRAGEAAAHARTWSAITGAFVAHNRRELPPTTPEPVSIDHRRGAAFAPGEGEQYVRAGWDLYPDLNLYIESVHRLSDRGAVFTWAGQGTSHVGFGAEWRSVEVMTVDGDLLDRLELFEEADLAVALARFDELDHPASRLENSASRAAERFLAYFAADDWDAISSLFTNGYFLDDRRRTINSGVRLGRADAIEDIRAAVDVGLFANLWSTVIATRGQRLALMCLHASGHDSEAIRLELLQVVETDADERLTAVVAFDVGDRDAAFAELEARYLAGEAAAHARSWSVIAAAFAAVSRGELPPSKPDWAYLDHRRGTPLAHSDLTSIIQSSREVTPNLRNHIETVHLMSDVGAVVTQVSYGSSQEGFDAEWRMINLMTVEGDLLNRCELFDESEIDSALARFEELSRPATRLENAASRAVDRFFRCFAEHDWTAMTDMLADDVRADDRRPVVNAGIRHGRDAEMADMRAIADLGTKDVTLTAIATRGEQLALLHFLFSVEDKGLEPYGNEALGVVEIDTENRICTRILFGVSDIDAAFEELDSRYIASEAAPCAPTWSVVTQAYAALNRHELAPKTSDFVHMDHHRLGLWKGDFAMNMVAAWEVTPDWRIRIVAVHRLADVGAVITCVAHGSSPQGFDAGQTGIALLTIQGQLINRFEYFDESDVDAALARFDELERTTTQLDNAAARISLQFVRDFGNHDWDALALTLAADFVLDDRRRLVGAGVRRGAVAEIEDLRAFAEVGMSNATATILSIRGDRLVLARSSVRGGDSRPDEVHTDMLSVGEVDDCRMTAAVLFDPDDVDAAFAELDARYITGEAAAHAHAWSVIVEANAAFNRREMFPTTPDWVNVDHRRGGLAFAPGDQAAYIRATWDVAPDVINRIVAVHRLSDVGAVFTQYVRATSDEGFLGEWRDVVVLTVTGDMINRCEVFDEHDLDAALATFDELNASPRQLENAATQARKRLADNLNDHNQDGFLALIASDGQYEDRRRLLRDEAADEGLRTVISRLFELPRSWRQDVEPIAVRGNQLALTRETFRDTGESNQPITVDLLSLTQVSDRELVSYTALFDSDDINGAMAELTARWIASGEVTYPEIVTTVCRLNETANLHDWEALAASLAGAGYLNHRQLARSRADTVTDYLSSIRTMASLVPDLRFELAEVLALSADGVVHLMVLKGTSTDGGAIELPIVQVTLVDGDRVTLIEAFDPAQRDEALTRFDELHRFSE